ASFSQFAFGQKEDPVLFTVDGTPVLRSEFDYIYSKTNGPDADYSKASLDEYLDLYINFKLKVQKAREMKLDTIKSLQQELDGYRRQLADSYLIDREVTEKLVQEAFLRSKEDVDVSHILIKLAPNPYPAEVKRALEKAQSIKAELESGKPFKELALKYSEDKSVKKNGGHIGWVTALFPKGFYALETAAYNTKPGEIAEPVRTASGYHILKVNGRRPARGEVEIAHILVRTKKNGDGTEAKKKIDEAYEKLVAGENFNKVCKAYSDDKVTANKGGYLGFFGINRYEKAFEDAAFGIAADGQFTKPIKTSAGWHILKRISKKENQTMHQAKSRLQNKIKQDPRFELAKKAMVERIKKESNFTENRTTLDALIASLQADTTNTFLTYKWKAPKPASTAVLFSFGGQAEATQGDFEGFMQRASRKRQQKAKQGIEAVVKMLYDDFVGDFALKYEEQQLEKKYPEFKSLMREYEEGVLLFEVTKMEVWDKASQDTAGLQAFYDKNKEKYQWKERAAVSEYTVLQSAQDQLNQIREYSKTHDPDNVLEKFNEDGAKRNLSVKAKKYEKGRNEVLDKMTWKVGEVSAPQLNKRNKSISFFKIEELLPPGQKTLKEARGYVVADYQDYLEKGWLKSLKDQYKVKVNDKVFNKMVKK
ncbi:MAG TPA: peptidyl-prolyl cis-trans isomerase, partial [Bacteroidetes bacterium]|nr:peptidyl-prolyl cis-trans isomerase [Bacteroidota bacterium]